LRLDAKHGWERKRANTARDLAAASAFAQYATRTIICIYWLFLLILRFDPGGFRVSTFNNCFLSLIASPGPKVRGLDGYFAISNPIPGLPAWAIKDERMLPEAFVMTAFIAAYSLQ